MKLWHALCLLFRSMFRRGLRKAAAKHLAPQAMLQIIVLPFEDNETLETERLERCPTLHAYYNPWTDQIKYVPVCAWRFHNAEVLRTIAHYYAGAEAPPEPVGIESHAGARGPTSAQLAAFPCAQARAASAIDPKRPGP